MRSSWARFFCLSLIRNELFLNEQCFPRKRNPEIENSKILPAFEFHRLSGQNETSNWPPHAIIQIEKFRTPHSQKNRVGHSPLSQFEETVDPSTTILQPCCRDQPIFLVLISIIIDIDNYPYCYLND